MLSEVRSLVAAQDQDFYDRLVLHRERRAPQACHGSLEVSHPESHHNHIVPVILDVGHTIPAMVTWQLFCPQGQLFSYQYSNMWHTWENETTFSIKYLKGKNSHFHYFHHYYIVSEFSTLKAKGIKEYLYLLLMAHGYLKREPEGSIWNGDGSCQQVNTVSSPNFKIWWFSNLVIQPLYRVLLTRKINLDLKSIICCYQTHSLKVK